MPQLQLTFGGESIAERFARFHEENPQVYAWLRHQALLLKRRGHSRYSIKTLLEVLRWRSDIKTSGDTFKINNDFTAHYARLLMQREPELQGFFELRRVRS